WSAGCMREPSMDLKPSRPPGLRAIVESFVAGVGLLLVVSALAANQDWFDRHFLPVFFLSRDMYVLGETLARLFIGALGIVLVLLVRPMIGRLAQHLSARELVAGTVRIVLAIVLALATSEFVLHRTFPGAAAEGPTDEEPLRRADARLGWTFVPLRIGNATV